MLPQEIFREYEEVLEISRQMLALARNSEWEGLIAFELERAEKVRKLLSGDGRNFDDPELNEKKAGLIRAILKCDEETGALSKVWMVELRQLINSLGTEKKLGNAYVAPE